MRSLKHILLSPYLLSVIPFLIIICTIPTGFRKYSIKSEGKTTLTGNHFYWFEDLDNDGSSEQIIAFNQDNTTAVTISNDNGLIDQWNFRGSFDFWFKNCLFICGDNDNNGIKELYVFTLNSDTILLHCIQNFNNPGLSIKNRVIAISGKGNKSPDPFIIPADMDDLNGDGENELIFGIGSGFSVYPRNVFAYYISKDSLVVSPESSYFISGILQSDINSDGKKEIIPHGYATSNVSPENARYHDYSSFLMVLDQNLRFLFEPIEFRGRYSNLTPFPFKRNVKPEIAWLSYSAAEKGRSIIYFVNNSGILTDSIPLNFSATNPAGLSDGFNEKGLPLLYLRNGVGLLGNDFRIVKKISEVTQNSYVKRDFDLDLDGLPEILFLDIEKGKISVYREGLRQGVSAAADISPMGSTIISIKYESSSTPVISIQSGLSHTLFRYGINPVYPFYYLYYPGIYLSILAFALIIRNIQKSQLKKKYETERKLSELQLALIRNQLDPHFTLNVINSIIYSIETSNKRKAGDGLRRFANLYRNLLLSAGSTQSKISEELDFCNDYLLLEKMRFGDRFDFRITVSDDVNRDALIPKLLIQIHAENAVKHGLSDLEKGGLLDINLRMSENTLRIEITDNGIGREESGKQKKISTGKGLAIMDELYSIYNKYYDDKVSSEITDLYNREGKPAGTRVIITIQGKSEKV